MSRSPFLPSRTSLAPPQLTRNHRLVRELMSRLLAPDPTQRITAAAALRSAWMSSSEQELLELYRRIVG